MSRVQYIWKKKKERGTSVKIMSRVQYIWKKKKEKVTSVQYNEQRTVHMEEKERKSGIGTI